MSDSIQIVPLTVDDVDAYVGHMRRHSLENGREGTPLFMPYGDEHPYDAHDGGERRRRLWAAAVDATDWGRGWGLQATPSDGSPPRLVGHIELQVSFPPTAHHRANMGMGLERGFRGRGQGRALLTTAIEWARAEPSLRWMDLGVFGGNERAIALYERFGFREVGRTAERFLVDGRPVEDISMTLFIGPGQRATAPA